MFTLRAVSTDDLTRLGGSLPVDDAATRVETPSSSTGWLSSSGAIDHGRFPPGTLLGGRYRIVGRLGRGGMGEVYRADDLKLGQPVALKFLPPDVDRDPALLTQLHTEVRMARQVSHPNVCRVYDIDEVDGHTFLSMEYVDGEDLSSLLRRIGRYPQDRGLELARQICAGLAAAHERGVVHRDFKPANVMVDGTGKARITDFGLAGLAGEALRAGTPAYMAPEQLAGGEVTPRSDIYSLGLVLYEIFTGQRALEGRNLAELIHKREQSGITPPSEIVRDLDPDIERTIQRCLKVDPAQRPSSALSVSASLPGGDPLAAALAAGETPSPEMVAAAGEEGALGRRAGIALLSIALVGVLAVSLLAGRTLLVNRVIFPKTADVLEEKAREVIALAGYTETPHDTARGVDVNGEYLRWIEQNDTSVTRWDAIGDGTAPLLDFWYRTSPRPLSPWSPEWMPQREDPPLGASGMITVVVDDRGRLVEFASMPPQLDRSAAPAALFDWGPMFQAAGLNVAQFSPAAPQWTPRTYADERVAWEGPMPQRATIKLRVEAASYRGRPIAFKVVGPWTRPARMEDPETETGVQRAADAVATVVIWLLIAGAILLVRINVRAGRADRRGANRIGLFLLVIWLASWLIGARHSFDPNEQTDSFFTAVAFSLLNVGLAWIFYLALEPFVRRLAPDMLIGWTRLLVGHWKDPRVGRDLLIGVATGVTFVLVPALGSFIPALTGAPPDPPQLSDMAYFVGARFAISDMFRTVPGALQTAMLGAFFYVVLLALVRRQWIAATLALLFVCGLILAAIGTGAVWVWVLAVALGIVTVVVFVRYGLLAFASAMFAAQMLNAVPLTLDLTRPHAGVSALAMLIVAALAAYAFHISRTGEGLFRRLLTG